MRLTNTFRDNLIDQASEYVFKKDVENLNNYSITVFEKLLSIFKETRCYKEGVEAYKNHPDYCSMVSSIGMKVHNHCDLFVGYDENVDKSNFRDLVNENGNVILYNEMHLSHTLNSDNFSKYGIERFAIKNNLGSIYGRDQFRFPNIVYFIRGKLKDSVDDVNSNLNLVKALKRDENGNIIFEEKYFDNDIKFLFDEDEKNLKEEYISAFSDLINKAWLLVERMNIFRKKIKKIVYSVNTTNQLLNILPNISKFIPERETKTKLIEEPVCREICKEIDDLLN